MWSLFSYKVIKVSKNDGLYEWQAAALWAHSVPQSLMQGLYSVNNEHSFLLCCSEDRRQSCRLVMSLQRSVCSCRHLQCSISTRWKMWHACKAWCRLLRTSPHIHSYGFSNPPRGTCCHLWGILMLWLLLSQINSKSVGKSNRKFTGGINSTEQTNQNSCGLRRLNV